MVWIDILSIRYFVVASRDAGTTVGQGGSKKFRAMQTYKKQTNRYQYVCFCSATTIDLKNNKL